jgi:CRP-like cAMP-binding protein
VRWPLLDALPPEHARAVLAMGRRRKFARGVVLFHEGDPGDTIHLIESGHVTVRVSTPMGDVATLRILGPGQYVGDLAVVVPGPRNATVTAIDPVETISLHRDEITRLRDQSPAVTDAMIAAVVEEVRRLSTMLLEAMYVPVPTRLSRRLLGLARAFPPGADGRTLIPLTQEDLAGLCGTTRPTVNQLLKKLVDKGAIELERGRVVITDTALLRRQAG